MGSYAVNLRPLRIMAITASRTSCGEALACNPNQRHFRLTVIVG